VTSALKVAATTRGEIVIMMRRTSPACLSTIRSGLPVSARTLDQRFVDESLGIDTEITVRRVGGTGDLGVFGSQVDRLCADNRNRVQVIGQCHQAIE
jgi:hypothetical protein